MSLHSIFAVVIVVLLLLSVSEVLADGAGTVEEQMLKCAEISSVPKRIECYDRLANSVDRSKPETVKAVEKTPEMPAAPAAEPVAPAAEPVITAPVKDSVVAEDTYGFREGVSKEEAKRKKAEEKAARKREKAERKKQKKLAKEQKKKDAMVDIEATIVKVQENHDRRFIILLDNDQVWKELQGSRVGMPRKGRKVKIGEGRLGGYRMKIEGLSQVAWVERIR